MKKHLERSHIESLLDITTRFMRLESYMSGRQAGKTTQSRVVTKMANRKKRFQQWLDVEERMNAQLRRPTET